MGAWTKNKVDSSLINGGQEYTRDSNPSLEQLNAITNNSFYAVDKADEALEKANSAFENNGTVVSVGGSPVANLSFNSNPQEQLNSKASVSDLNTASENKANKDLSNVTYPQVIANGVAQTGDGDRVIEMKVYSDGRTWYRKWASGWKECGGFLETTTAGQRIVFPITFENDPPFVVAQVLSTDNHGLAIRELSTTGFNTQQNLPMVWYACGY